MRGMGLMWAFCAGVCLFGCSDEPAEPDSNIVGHWCGKEVAGPAECLGDEVQYLELTQETGGSVFGVHYEAYGKEGYTVQNGHYQDGQLTYFYVFDVFRVDAQFAATDSNTLNGSLFSNKCACDIPTTLYRVE